MPQKVVYVVVTFDPPEYESDAVFDHIAGVYETDKEAREESEKWTCATVVGTYLYTKGGDT